MDVCISRIPREMSTFNSYNMEARWKLIGLGVAIGGSCDAAFKYFIVFRSLDFWPEGDDGKTWVSLSGVSRVYIFTGLRQTVHSQTLCCETWINTSRRKSSMDSYDMDLNVKSTCIFIYSFYIRYLCVFMSILSILTASMCFQQLLREPDTIQVQ